MLVPFKANSQLLTFLEPPPGGDSKSGVSRLRYPIKSVQRVVMGLGWGLFLGALTRFGKVRPCACQAKSTSPAEPYPLRVCGFCLTSLGRYVMMSPVH